MGLTRIRAEQISDIDYKQAVRVITLTDITLSGGAPAEVDGVSLTAGDRILVAGQSNAAQNGLYQVQTVGAGSNGTWVRTTDGNEDGEIQPGMVVMVTQGNQYADTPWKLVTNGEIIIGTTEMVFEENYSLAFGNVFANGTAVIANTVSAGLTLTAGDNIAITGNNTTKTVTIGVTGITTSRIANGTSNVDIASANADITMSVAGTSNVVVVSTDGITVTGNVIGNGISTTTVSSEPPANPEQGDIWIDSDTAVQLIYFNDGNSNQWAEMEAFQTFGSGSGSGTVDLSAVAQDIIPSANATYSLGNATNRWANLFLVGNTIDLGGAQIKADAESGAIAFIPAPTANVANPTALVISATGAINTANTVGGEISGESISNAASTATPVGAPRIANIVVTGNTYSPTGATAVALEGGYVQITGNGFQSGCQAIIGSNNATATGFSSSETLDVEVPAQSAGTYIVYVVNPDGAVALRPNGITYSGLPTWVTGSTLPTQTSGESISIQLEATSDSAVTYALAAGSSLPANVSLNSSGLITGTASVEELTVFSFTIVATDAESQSSPRTFDLTIDVLALNVEYLVVAGGAGGGRSAPGAAGGGGAGGVLTDSTTFSLATNYSITIGGGGAGATTSANGSDGSDTTISGENVSITSLKGGGGGGANLAGTGGNSTYGSGGGSSSKSVVNAAGTSGQGNSGGQGKTDNASYDYGGGGGGAGGAGTNAATNKGGDGGIGIQSAITGSNTYYAGGGGGGGFLGSGQGAAGQGGGGAGGGPGGNGSNNSGGGGGGGQYNNANGGNGGSGVVILKYPDSRTISNPGGGLTLTTSTAVAGYKITTITAGTGNIQWN